MMALAEIRAPREEKNNNFKINHRNYENGLNVAFASGERFMPTSSELRGDCVS